MVNSKHCRKHGGLLKPLRGPQHPNWNGGTSSDSMRMLRYANLPKPLEPAYLKALRDPEILSLEQEIALIDTRLQQLVAKIGQNDDWESVGTLYQRLVAAINASDSNALTAAMNDLKDLAFFNVDANHAWSKVIALTDRRRALVESERKRLVEQHMFLTREEAHQYSVAILEIVTRNVRDKQTLSNIFDEFAMFMKMHAKEAPQLPDING